MDYVISEENAEEIFQQFLDYYDISMDDFEGSQEKAAFQSKRKLINTIRKGLLEIKIGEDIEVIQKLTKHKADSLTYTEVSAAAKMTMDKTGENEQYGKIYTLLGSLSGLGLTAIMSLKGKDLSVAECLGFFFLQV